MALRLRELCEQYGISHRMPRAVIPDEKRILNKSVVAALANPTYLMDLHGEPSHGVWAYRKAAWAIEETEQDLGLIYRQMGARSWRASTASGHRWQRRTSI